LILGRMAGMGMVGYFGRAMGLVSMFDRFVMSALWSVALPHFAQQSRDTGAMKGSFLRSMTYATALAWPFFACLGLLAHPVILILYGKQWEPSVSLLRLLCIYMMMLSPFLLMSSMMTAIGQMKQNLYLLLIHVPVRIVLVWLAAPLGIEAIGVAFIAGSLVDITIYYLQCRFILYVNLREIAQALYKSAGVAFLSMLLPLCVFLFGDDILSENIWLQLMFDFAGCALGWLAGIFLFEHPLKFEVKKIFKTIQPFLNFSK